MHWVPDRTGRFRTRPHYEPAELDSELGRLVSEFLTERYGVVRYPITTDDLTVLIERSALLDPYADLSAEGVDVEGVTYFDTPDRPLVRIASELSTDARRSNRYRTTLTHEFTHVHLHAFLWKTEAPSLPLLPTQPGGPTNGPRCKRESIIGARQSDWMEWQAAYGCGALLMPALAMAAVVDGLGLGQQPVAAVGADAERALQAIMESFGVSQDAARMRLFKLGLFRPATVQPLPF